MAPLTHRILNRLIESIPSNFSFAFFFLQQLFFMAATTRRPLPTLKVKKLPPPRLPSPDKSNMTTTRNGRNADPLEKRLLNIRLHLLQNTRRRQQNPSEPTLVFDSFLYLGGLKSLSNKVCTIFSFRLLFNHSSLLRLVFHV